MAAFARWLVLCLVATGLGCASAPPPPPPPAAFDFHRALRPYGQWLVVPPYGKVWAPNPELVGKDFVPYLTSGHWQYTPRGWSFASDFEFGELVFHHGRWVRVQSLGWLWLEDQRWGPAFVDWRAGGEYVGWACTPPPPLPGAAPPPVPEFTYVRARNFARPEVEQFRALGDEVGRAVEKTAPLVPAPGVMPGPPVELLLSERGLVKDDQGALHLPDFSPPPTVEAAPEAPEPQPAPPPPEKKKPKKKKPKAKAADPAPR
jgi:hypothetical protein